MNNQQFLREIDRKLSPRNNQQETSSDVNHGKEVLALTGEIASGVTLDAATNWMLVNPVPGSRVAYGAINALGGAGANYVAQQYRTEEDLAWYDRNWGEVISSGVLGIIPGMGGKAGKFTRFVGKPNTYKRAVTSGIGTGVADQLIRKPIDEGRLPTGGELVSGAAVGGIAGPAFKKATDEFTKIVGKYKGRSPKDIEAELTEAEISTLETLLQSKQPLSKDDESKLRLLLIKLNAKDYLEVMADDNVWSSEPTPDIPKVIYHRDDITKLTSDGRRIFPWESADGKRLQAQPKGRQAIRSETEVLRRYAVPIPQGQTRAGDIDIASFNLGKDNPDGYRNFEVAIQNLLREDDIRVQDIPYLAKEGKTPIMGSKTPGAKGEDKITVREIYNDYLVGYFNRWIRTGVKDNFQDAARLILPNGKIVAGNPTLLRAMKLFIISPDKYRPDPFKATSETYRNQLAEMLNKYKIKDRAKFIKKVRAHHIQMIDEGWPLFRGLPSEEIPIMRELLERYKLFSGNAPENLLLIPDKYHKKLHNKYWPLYAPNWDVEDIYKIKTAAGRAEYIKEYAEAVKNTMVKVNADLDYAASVISRKKRKDLNPKDWEKIIEGIDPELLEPIELPIDDELTEEF